MDRRYDAYCAADPLFYDSLTATPKSTHDFEVAGCELPEHWQRQAHDDWFIFGPRGASLPRQGWKVHVSGCPDNAERILRKLWDYCVPRDISFKFLRSRRVLFMRNSKYSPRASSGKLATIYPSDEVSLSAITDELGELLRGEVGPYILSDLRIGEGPLYVRYGAFAHLYCVAETGELVPALVGPDGTFEPDRREAVFRTPSWVTLPEFLQPHLDARNATTTAGLPYRVEEVLHYSNAGGLYIAVDTRTDERVVLKEARPHAGLDGRGDDAVTRLRRERQMLDRVADAGVAPRVRDSFVLGGHEFLVLEFVDGEPLNKLVVEKYPLVGPNHDAATMRTYTDWALDIGERVAQAVGALHERGVVHGDLHMFNVMVRPDGRVALLDFEVAAPDTDLRRPGLRNQGFAAPRDRVGKAVDEYALACLRLALFLPLTPLLRLDLTKARHCAQIVGAHFPVPRNLLDDAVDTIVGSVTGPEPDWSMFAPGPHGRADWPRCRDALARAVLASATPDRADRLYPGDIDQFRVGGLGLAHGAPGVLYALREAGVPVPPEHVAWLREHAVDPGFDPRHGLLEGLHGAAWVLDRLGERAAALDVVDRSLKEGWENLGLDLAGGVTGIGLNLLDLGRRADEPALREAGARAAEIAADRLGTVESVPTTSGGKHPHAGLTHGGSGVALLFLRMYDETGDTGYLDLAAVALRQDLRRCVLRPDGALEVDEGWRTMPYLAEGSVGIGLVLHEYLSRRADDGFVEAAAQIARAARSPMYVQPGLFEGRAGIVAYHAARMRSGSGPAPEPVELRAQVHRLVWHALPYGGGFAFPGSQLLRLSMDLATGTAGVLLAMATALADHPVGLPLPGFAPDPPGTTNHPLPHPLGVSEGGDTT